MFQWWQEAKVMPLAQFHALTTETAQQGGGAPATCHLAPATWHKSPVPCRAVPVPDHPPAAGQLGQRGDLRQPLHHVLLIAAHCGHWLHLGEGGGGAGPGGAGSGLLAAVGAPAGEHGSVGRVAAARITYHCSVLLSAADLRPRSPHSQAQSPAWKVSPWQVLVQARLARQEGSSTQLAWVL